MSITYNNDLSKRKQTPSNYNNNIYTTKARNISKKSISQKKYEKISDIITQVKPTSYFPNFINNSPYNINNTLNQLHQTAFTPINKKKVYMMKIFYFLKNHQNLKIKKL